MRALLVPALITLVAAGCGPAPAEPVPDTLTGRWEGTFTSTECQFTGSYSSCHYLAPGQALFAGILLLEPDGQSVAGYGQTSTFPDDLLRREAIEGGFLRQFHATLGSDGRLRFSVTNGASPTFVHELSWDLRLVSDSRMEGTLTLRDRWYKQAGDIRASGTVTLTRR